MTVQLTHGDCLEALRDLADDSVDSIVTDPPAGIGFMGKEWDHHKGGRDEWIAWLTEVMTEAHRVLKPGGHALVWALPRTSHWTATALEDAGFEIRDRVSHIFGTGFPKSLDIGKAIDKAAGAEREPSGAPTSLACEYVRAGVPCVGHGTGIETSQSGATIHALPTAPATPEAAEWDGWGTAMKPAVEDWWLCRKPLAEKTVAANVLAWGTGGINIDATRVGTNGESLARGRSTGSVRAAHEGWNRPLMNDPEAISRIAAESAARTLHAESAGRWPAHLLLSHAPGCVEVGTRKVKSAQGVRGSDSGNTMYGGGNGMQRPSTGQEVGYADPDGTETIPTFDCEPGCPVAELDLQSGDSKSPPVGSVARVKSRADGDDALVFMDRAARVVPNGHGDRGGASRFFPTFHYASKAPTKERPKVNGVSHPTVKSLDLMKWLIRLVTPPGGTVLDCFAGSGATLEAAELLGFNSIGIEAEAAYIPLIESRISRTQPTLT